jgi:predicted SAM-dependent methyltransferase/tetratricopeptide (TPR) repeat protein
MKFASQLRMARHSTGSNGKTRLHLGCGLIHRPGWINLDRYATGAADARSNTLLLPFPDETAEAIICRQVVEILGYVGTLYALYEWWRVLTPNGTLIIETPDRPMTFQAAVDRETASLSLPWIFGSEQIGFGHRYLFDADELIHLVVESGFEIVSVEHLKFDQLHPTLELRARRMDSTPATWFNARLHRAFITSGLVDPKDAPSYLVTLETIAERACAFVTQPGREALIQLLNLSARHSPKVTLCILNNLPRPETWDTEDLERARALAQALDTMQFPARLASHWRDIPKLPGKKQSLWAILEREISFYLAAQLFPGEGLDDIRKSFDAATAEPSPNDAKVMFFSEEVLNELALQITAAGVRAFAYGDHDTALEHLELALRYQPNLIWPRWNLARLYLLLDRRLEALGLYDSLRATLPERLHPAFERERQAVTTKDEGFETYLKPLAELRELLAPKT